MATATYSVLTGATDLNTVWRKVQAGVLQAFKFDYEEWGWLNKLKNFDVDWSSREITFEADLDDDINTAMIAEGGKEARPSSQKPSTCTVTWVQANKRFTISKTSRYIEQQQGVRGQLISQFKYQTKKAVQGIRRKIADQFYGFSTGTVAKVSAVSTDDITIKDLYGVSGLGSLTGGPGAGISNRAATDVFRAGDFIAVLNPSGPALRTGGIVEIDTVTRATNILTGADVSGISGPADDDLIVFANNVENTTLAGGTERNQNLVGLEDMLTSASIHSLSSATNGRWDAALNNSSGGRFDGVKLRKLKQAISNKGGGMLDTVIWSQGVENDVFAQLQAGLRFSDSFSMEMDGKPVSKGITFHTSLRVPDGYVFGYDSKNSVKKMVLLPEPGTLAWDDGDKLQDDNGYVFGMDYPCAMVVVNRGNLGAYSGITQQ